MNGGMFSDSPFSPSAPYLCCSDLLRPGSDRGRRGKGRDRRKNQPPTVRTRRCCEFRPLSLVRPEPRMTVCYTTPSVTVLSTMLHVSLGYMGTGDREGACRGEWNEPTPYLPFSISLTSHC